MAQGLTTVLAGAAKTMDTQSMLMEAIRTARIKLGPRPIFEDTGPAVPAGATGADGDPRRSS
jgi:hypothetical protein